MGSLKTEAENYEAKGQKNIAELKSVEVSNALITETRQNSNGDDYTTSYIVVETDGEGHEYRVPSSVIAQLQEVLKATPKLKTFKVTRTGTGLGTKYQVIALE